MTLGWAGKDAACRAVPVETIRARAQAAGVLGTTRYWTPEIHVGAFHLPPYIASTCRALNGARQTSDSGGSARKARGRSARRRRPRCSRRRRGGLVEGGGDRAAGIDHGLRLAPQCLHVGAQRRLGFRGQQLADHIDALRQAEHGKHLGRQGEGGEVGDPFTTSATRAKPVKAKACSRVTSSSPPPPSTSRRLGMGSAALTTPDPNRMRRCGGA